MKKVIANLLLLLFCSCSSQNKEYISVEQIDSNYPIIIRSNQTKDKIRLIQFPLAYTISKNSLKETKLYIPNYRSKGKYVLENDNWIDGPLIYFVDNNNKLQFLDQMDEKRLLSSFSKKEYIFYTSHIPDTAQNIQSIFKPYLKKMKLQGKDTLNIESIQQMNKINKDFLVGFLDGDSICIKYTKGEKSIYIYMCLPVEIK